jgi:hypothetical protein
MNTTPFPQLQAFLMAARHKSFSGAARELGVSRSAVSQSVRQLEEQLRVGLLVRTTRSVSLTDAGRRLLESAGPALGQVISALHEVGAGPGETVGRVRLSVPRAAVPFVIDPVVPTIRARHPHIEVEVAIDDRFVDCGGRKPSHEGGCVGSRRAVRRSGGPLYGRSHFCPSFSASFVLRLSIRSEKMGSRSGHERGAKNRA